MFAALKDRVRRLADWIGGNEAPAVFREPLPFWCEHMAEAHVAIYRRVRNHTMTSPERVAALCQAIAYLEQARVPGAIVECGVWRGGSMMAAALALLRLESTCRPLYLFDTYHGMTAPAEVDRDLYGRSARELLAAPTHEGDHVRARCNLHEVRAALHATRYPCEKMVFVPGPVEETLPAAAPERIALLRLDTDWYESTRHELETLYPRLADGGVLIVDDYGHWQGAQRAVDEFFARQDQTPRLFAIDYTGRLVVKKSAPVQARAA